MWLASQHLVFFPCGTLTLCKHLQGPGVYPAGEVKSEGAQVQGCPENWDEMCWVPSTSWIASKLTLVVYYLWCFLYFLWPVRCQDLLILPNDDHYPAGRSGSRTAWTQSFDRVFFIRIEDRERIFYFCVSSNKINAWLNLITDNLARASHEPGTLLIKFNPYNNLVL